MKPSTFLGFLALALPFADASRSRRHQEVAHRARADVDNVADADKRSFEGSRFTFYEVGLGACGKYSVPTDMIVAMNIPQFGEGYPGPNCFKSITISYGGKTANATIMDKCQICPYGGLDFSPALFEYFADLAEGVLYGDWWFN